MDSLSELATAWAEYQRTLRELLEVPGGLANANALLNLARTADDAAIRGFIADLRAQTRLYREALNDRRPRT
jgi:hypothetical protein